MSDRPNGPAIRRATRAPGLTVLSGFGRPFGFGQDTEGRIIVADMDVHGICRLDGDFSAFQWLMTDAGWSAPQSVQTDKPVASRRNWHPERFNGPHSIAVAADGTHYVVTYYDPGLHIFDESGLAGQLVGRDGEAAQNLVGPATGQIGARDSILVTDYGAHSVAIFAPGGHFLGAIGGGIEGISDTVIHPAGSKPGQFDRPHMCRILPDGHLIVADTWNHRLQRFTVDGIFRGALGGGKDGWRYDDLSHGTSGLAGAFHAPVAIGLAAESIFGHASFVVTDWGNNRLQWFNADGELLRIDDDLALDRPYDAQVFGNQLFVANSHCGEVIVRTL